MYYPCGPSEDHLLHRAYRPVTETDNSGYLPRPIALHGTAAAEYISEIRWCAAVCMPLTIRFSPLALARPLTHP